jgi:hypothetical protein
MKRHHPAIPLFTAICVLGAAAASSCGDDVARSRDASATPGAAAPSPAQAATLTVVSTVATPEIVTEAVPSTGVAALDEMIAAALTADIDALMSRVSYERMGCVTSGQLGSPVTCPDGVPEGSLIEAFPYAQCDGGWIPPDVLRAALVRTFDGTVALYAVLQVRSPEPGETHLIVFEEGRAPFPRGFWLNVRDGRIVARGGPCVPLPQSDIFVNAIAVLVPPPDER